MYPKLRRMNRFLSMLVVLLLGVSCLAVNTPSDPGLPSSDQISTERPKLVVGIVVDQMRYDFLTRFESKYGDGGFKRLINYGFNCRNNHFNYIPTKTGPGHASIFTGTTPNNHGIIGNSWFDRYENKSIYCTRDYGTTPLGTTSEEGQMSPRLMIGTTFSDENRLFTQMKGKTIGISIKHRGAVLPAGHSANAAYWFYGRDEGQFVSSSYYMQELPGWVKEFNSSGIIDSHMQVWNTLYPIEQYVESGPDLNEYEGGFFGKKTATFPYDLNELKEQNKGYDIIKSSPFGNSMITDFTLAAIREENLGKDEHVDVLTVSYSSTDYVGHNFGANSKEIQDVYLRLDKEIERLLNYLDEYIGPEEYVLFLTSDHGAVDVPSYLRDNKIPAGYIDYNVAKSQPRLFNINSLGNLTNFLMKSYGTTDIIQSMSNEQVFLNREKIVELKLDLVRVQEEIAREVSTYPEVMLAYSAHSMRARDFGPGIGRMLQNGFHELRSGDILIVYYPGFISSNNTGSHHGSGFNYDTHVPLIFYGFGIKPGSTDIRTEIIDVAPTISSLLGISFPNMSTGKVLDFVLD